MVTARDAQAVHQINVNETPYSLAAGEAGPELKIQQAIDDAADIATAHRPVTVFVGPGTYTGAGLRDLPGTSGTIGAMLWMRSNVRLKFADGAILKLANGITLDGDWTEWHGITNLNPFSPSTLSENMVIENVTLDGNAANQSGITGVMSVGMFFGTALNSRRINCRVLNWFGTGDIPPAESFHFNTNSSFNCVDIDCVADGRGSASTATGFSMNNCFGCYRRGCTAIGMGHGHGFTAWQCGGFTDVDCRSHLNAGCGFNYERCADFGYENIIAGGRTAPLGNGNYPLAAVKTLVSRLGYSTTLAASASSGATTITVASVGSITVGDSVSINGFDLRTVTNIAGSVLTLSSAILSSYASGATVRLARVRLTNGIGVRISGCINARSSSGIVTFNTVNLSIEGNSGGLDARQACNGVFINGGDYRFATAGTQYNVLVEKASDGDGKVDQSNVLLQGQFKDTTTFPNSYGIVGTRPQQVIIDLVGDQGYRTYIYGANANAAAWSIYADDTVVFRADKAGRVRFGGVVTGMRSVSTSGTITIADHTILASGTLSLALPTHDATNAPLVAGQEFLVLNIGTGIITLTPGATGNFLGGGTSKKIPPGASIRVKWSDTAWIPVSQQIPGALPPVPIGSYQSSLQTTSGTGTCGQSVLRASPMPLAADTAYDRIGIEVTTLAAASTFRLGIYADNGNNYPGDLILDASTIDATGTGFKENTIAQTLPAGMYWIGGASQGGDPALRVAVGTLPMIGVTSPAGSSGATGYVATGVTGALPSTFPTTVTPGATMPRVYLRRSA